MGGVADGRTTVGIDSIGNIAISGKVPTTAAGGGSNVAVTNVSGDIRVTSANLPLTVSANQSVFVSGQIKTTAVGAGGAAAAITNVSGDIRVTAGNIPLPVNVVQTSAQIHVTAGGLSIPVTIAAQPIAVSVNAGVMVSGQIKTTAVGAGGAAVAITNVSGQIRVTAGDLSLPVNIASPGINIGISAAALPQMDVSAHGSITIGNVSGQVPITAGGLPIPVTIAAQPLAVSAAAATWPVQITNVSGQVQVTSPGGPLTDVCGVNRTGSAMNVFLAGTSAQVHVTAGDTPLPVLASISGQVKVTAGDVPLTVSGAGGNGGATRSDALFNATVSNPVKFGKLAQVAGAVCADIVAGVASRRIRVLGGYFNSTGTATAIFMTTGASAALTPKIVINTGFVLPINPYGYFETAVGSALSLQIESGSVGGIITYQEVF